MAIFNSYVSLPEGNMFNLQVRWALMEGKVSDKWTIGRRETHEEKRRQQPEAESDWVTEHQEDPPQNWCL